MTEEDQRVRPARRTVRLRVLLAAPLLALLAGSFLGAPATAADWPVLKPGQWDYKHTVDGTMGKHTMTSSRCSDPTAEIKNQAEKLTKTGCRLLPITKSGNHYGYSAECSAQNVTAHVETVLTIESDSAYSLRVTTTGRMTTEETLLGRRIGDCVK